MLLCLRRPGGGGSGHPSLTCAQSQPQTADEVVVEPVVVPHRDLHAGLSEVLRAETVIHHGVVEHGAGCPLHHPGLLSGFPAAVWKDGAAVEESHSQM